MVVTLDLRSTVELTDDRFEQICQSNRDLKFERTAIGELVVVALTGGETGRRNIKLSARLEMWNEQSETGVAFDSSTGFRLPNGAIRSPDAAWIRLDRWEVLTSEQRKKLVPLCPDFLVELRSPSDEIADIQAKMREYQENGLRLGWLLDPETQRVEIYRGDSFALGVRTVEILENPTQLSGEDILAGFSLNLTGILNS
jgi:Uma2 family endonuclease